MMSIQSEIQVIYVSVMLNIARLEFLVESTRVVKLRIHHEYASSV